MIPDNLKTFRDAEKEEILESEMNHNFEADMYLEKLEHENEKVICFHLNWHKKSQFPLLNKTLYFFSENRAIR